MPRLVLSDSDWERIAAFLPGSRGKRGRPPVNSRAIVEGILWRIRTGAPWRDLPKEFGSWSTVFSRFNRWSKNGVWDALFQAVQLVPDSEWNFIDSTIVKVHQHGSGARRGENRAIGASRGGNTTKIHALADAIGSPLKFVLTEGQVHDSQPVAGLIANAQFDCLIADKAYDSGTIRSLVIGSEAVPIIPQRSNSTGTNPFFDLDIYKARHVIENLFQKLKQWRAFATRYDKTARNYLAVVSIAGAMVWLQ